MFRKIIFSFLLLSISSTYSQSSIQEQTKQNEQNNQSFIKNSCSEDQQLSGSLNQLNYRSDDIMMILLWGNKTEAKKIAKILARKIQIA